MKIAQMINIKDLSLLAYPLPVTRYRNFFVADRQGSTTVSKE